MDGFQLAEAIKADSAIADVALVLLPSHGRRGDGERARQVGIAAYLKKPVRQAQLFECLQAVITHSGSEPFTARPLVTQHSIREAEVRPRDTSQSSLRILVAEDSLVNQAVALGQLFNLGYRAEAVPLARRFVDPVNGLSLEQATARAIEQEPSLRAVRSQVDAALGAKLQASLRPNPSVSFERREEPGGMDNLTAVGVEWPLDLFRRSRRLAVADGEVTVARLSAADRERLLAADVRASCVPGRVS
jgi:hypothetical protein